MGHSLRRATTGSFLAALREGIRPEMSVSSTLMPIRTRAAGRGSTALRLPAPVTACITALMGYAQQIGHHHADDAGGEADDHRLGVEHDGQHPLGAPMARRMPISRVRSCTEMRVMTPIMMEDTTREMATNAIST